LPCTFSHPPDMAASHTVLALICLMGLLFSSNIRSTASNKAASHATYAQG